MGYSFAATKDLTNHDLQLVEFMNILGDPNRYKIFKLLLSGQELCVSEIAMNLGVSVSAVSQHFRIFEQAGLVSKKRYGQKICYQIIAGDSTVNKISELVNK